MAGQIAAQEVQMGVSPRCDQLVILAVADRPANQKQHLRQWMGDASRLARVLDLGKIMERRLQAGLLEPFKDGNRH